MKWIAAALVRIRHAAARERRRDDTLGVVCLCGSTRFKDAFEEANRRETLAGRIVLSVAIFGHCETEELHPEVKHQLDMLHLKKIDLAEEVLVINVNGYIGESTRREIAYANERGKRIRYLEEATVCVLHLAPELFGPGWLPQPSLS